MTIALRSILLAGLALATAACGDKTAETAKTETTTTTTGAAAVPAGTDWTKVTAATPEGGFRIGNPDAKVKLLEFASLTCPHCSEFHEAAMATIRDKYVASGNVSYEFRNFVLNGPDYAASMLARCQGAEPFFGLLAAFFTDQTSWTEPFTKLTPEDSKRLSALPEDQQIAALAELGKLDEYMRTRGMPRAKFDQCLADKAALEKLAALRTQATDTYKLTGTPGFIINGVTQEGVFTWDALEPKLKAALS
ncbi:thioredoxin domain-containing protein [Polymorphobacter fuscus]|uniref:Thioredoxin domain-containing protein n=1 Tax=Sandarakinorhabdus fusca TaxID=1439888 RepID=A0A7C9KYB7_9SPHN|nr:thioredoxin domain-containing protein [Polymorphobacter fuscus]KAB7644346.1 thioredoxin domain-containing protein [Polymorphobacter fuscus]MQT18262.1 thioredoxin domain-containing protein [Polymorphobacter fuscus]NJC08155.1 protein-disulfide isomerase [Polymorphobacter fuscus]